MSFAYNSWRRIVPQGISDLFVHGRRLVVIRYTYVSICSNFIEEGGLVVGNRLESVLYIEWLEKRGLVVGSWLGSFLCAKRLVVRWRWWWRRWIRSSEI
jgi:hypothetical protein